MGMDIQSFYQLTPGEFEVIYSKWSEFKDAELRNGWEQTRAKCYWIAGPNLKKGITIKSFMPFSWDKIKKTRTKKQGRIHDPERFKRLQEEYGATI
jgi:hypothetical protein